MYKPPFLLTQLFPSHLHLHLFPALQELMYLNAIKILPEKIVPNGRAAEENL